MIPFLLFSMIFSSILLCVFLKIPIVFALTFGVAVFYGYGIKKGISFNTLIRVSIKGALKSRLVLEIFILIGMITSLWICSGSVPFLVYHSLNIIQPCLFLFLAFMASAFVSLLLGTSFGVVSTIGIVIIMVARISGYSAEMTAGAIISGAYFGDRISPMSSSANLVAAINNIDLYSHIRNMIKTTFTPLALVMAAYLVLSFIFPLHVFDKSISEDLIRDFKMGWQCMIPVLTLFVLIIFRVRIKKAMLISSITAFLTAVLYQNSDPAEVFKMVITGFHQVNPVGALPEISGGGIVSMLYPALVVAVSSAYAGVIEETKILLGMEKLTEKICLKSGPFASMSFISVFSCATGCTQTLGIILGEQLASGVYLKNGIPKERLALDISNTSVLIAAVIPWNMAGMVPSLTLSVDAAYIPFSFYCFFPTLYILLKSVYKHKKSKINF